MRLVGGNVRMAAGLVAVVAIGGAMGAVVRAQAPRTDGEYRRVGLGRKVRRAFGRHERDPARRRPG